MSDLESEQYEADDLLQVVKDDAETNSNWKKEEQNKYDEILHASRNKVRILVILALIRPLLSGTREFILGIYMQSLSPQTTVSIISTIIFIYRLWNALIQVITTWLGDKYGHDTMLLFTFLFAAIGVFIESIANNLWIFTIGFFMSCAPIKSITMAYIATILPHKYAISEMSKYFGAASVIHLLGPTISGIIVNFTNYRTVFWLNAIILFSLNIINITFIRGSQRKLQSQQQALSDNFTNQQQDDDVFPICNFQNISQNSWAAFFNSISKKKLILLYISIIQNNAGRAIECVLLIYFSLFFVNRFGDKNILIMYISGMSSCILFSGGISMMLIPKLFPRIIPKYVYIISITSFLFVIFMIITIIIGYTNEIILYWIICPFIGIVFGIFHIATEMCILETQPKQHSGKVSGIKAGSSEVLKAFAILLVGVAWSGPYYNAIWIGHAFCAFIVLVLSFVVWYMACRME